MEIKRKSLNSLCGALCYGIGIEPPKEANEKNEFLSNYFDEKLKGKKADRLVMYNPDAIGEWVFTKYPELVKPVTNNAEFTLPLESVMPSVTPVNFGTMYTGANPDVHGITCYARPVIKIDSFFDALVRQGKKVALCSQTNCSMSLIFLERPIDYFIYDTIEEINAKASELIIKDEYDVIIIYNTNYDSVMHGNNPENFRTLAELRANGSYFGFFANLIKNVWKGKHDTILGFSMDHGCHYTPNNKGDHGSDSPLDCELLHSFTVINK